MPVLQPYLMFNGNCREAMAFYQKCLGGELEISTFGDAPGMEVPEESKDKIMHAALKSKEFYLMASDGMPDSKIQQGENVYLSLNCANTDEAERLFKSFSEKGKVVMPLQQTFWAVRYGMLVDQYGICWMVNCDK